MNPGAPAPAAPAQSTAFEGHDTTTVGRNLEDRAGRRPGLSGFAIIRYGRPAFTARIALTELAEHSLDLQYYIWEADATGRILAERLVRAADRGVRVRVLLDDINLKGRDSVIAALDAHPGIEIRLFNPFARRRLRALDFLTDFNRVNHRMHNKLLVMDNAVAIVGGRNIGDHYFDVDSEARFRDLDIAAGGPVVQEISSVFDHFWNGRWSVPVATLADRPQTGADLEAALATMRERMARDDYLYPLDQDIAELKSELGQVLDRFVWAPGAIVWDDPASIFESGRTSRMNDALFRRLGTIKEELLIEFAYFVPRDRAVETARSLCSNGVRIRVLTNSLASNDVLAAHAGYAKRRAVMVAAGVELHELHPCPGPVDKKIVSGPEKADEFPVSMLSEKVALTMSVDVVVKLKALRELVTVIPEKSPVTAP